MYALGKWAGSTQCSRQMQNAQAGGPAGGLLRFSTKRPTMDEAIKYKFMMGKAQSLAELVCESGCRGRRSRGGALDLGMNDLQAKRANHTKKREAEGAKT